MFDYKTVVTDDELTIQFKADPNISNRVLAYQGEDIVGYVDIAGGTFEASNNDIFMQYKLWQTRPERKVGKIVSVEGVSLDQLMDTYEELLIGSYILNKPNERITKDTIGKNGFCIMLDWLRSTDFFTSPASTQYHESYVGGLLVHTLRVYNMAMTLLSSPMFSGISVASAALVALTHDWCKIGLYESYQRNVKNESTGKWEQVAAFRRNQKGIPLGHGATSMFLASKFFKLSADEALAIRWHQGHWNVCDSEVNEFQLANENYPLVHLTQFADQLSITTYAVKEGNPVSNK